MTEATELTIDHYSRPEVKSVILEYCRFTGGSRALNAGEHWYKGGEDPKTVMLRGPDDYNQTIEKGRPLYCTLDILESSVFERAEQWIEERGTPEHPIGDLSNCLAFTLSTDIDAVGDIRNLDIKEAVEDAAWFHLNYLSVRGIRKSVYCLYSGGGIYIHIHHGLWTTRPETSPEEKKGGWQILLKAYNRLIEDISREFFRKFPQHIGKVKFDKLNNQKRTFKTIFSIHKSLPYAVIPLDSENPKIDFKKASLPLSDKVLESGKNWYKEFDLEEKDWMIELLEEKISEVREIIKNRPTGNGEISRASEPIPLEKFPPCMKNIIQKAEAREGRHRALGVLATYLYQAGWSEDEAFDLWAKVADRCGVEPRIFETEWGRVCCPRCDTMNKDTGGYPSLNLYRMGFCNSDAGCLRAIWPGDYGKTPEQRRADRKNAQEERESSDVPSEPILDSSAFDKSGSLKEESTATILVRLAQANSSELWHTPDGEAYITLPINSHKEHYKIASKSVRSWMGKLGRELMCTTVSLSAIKDAVNVLEGIALFDGPEYPLYIRKSEFGGKIYVDLGDPSWKAVKISRDGWKVIENSPVRFKRARNSLPLPMPERGGNIADLRDLINAPTEESWILALAWLTQAFWCRGPFAHLYLRGSQGTVKSGMMVTLKAISDPSAAKKRQIPKSQRELMITAGNESIPSFDNISTVSDTVADSLCVISTGGVSAARALWTDDEESLIRAKGAVILNGIPDLSQRGDLLDRTIILDLDPIPKDKRITEREAEAKLEALKPKLLGALLDITVEGLKNFDRVNLQNPPRMADFAQWVVACEPRLPWKAGRFLEIYCGAREDVERDLVESNRFPLAVYRLAIDSAPGYWQGTATELLSALNQKEHVLAGYEPEGWPKSPDKLGSELRRYIQALLSRGVTISFRRSDKKGSRKIIIKLADSSHETDSDRQKKTAINDSTDSSDTSFSKKEKDIVNKKSIEEAPKKDNKNFTPSSRVSAVRLSSDNDSSLTATDGTDIFTPKEKASIWEAIAYVLKHSPRKSGDKLGLTLQDLDVSIAPSRIENYLRASNWTSEQITASGITVWWTPEKALKVLGLI